MILLVAYGNVFPTPGTPSRYLGYVAAKHQTCRTRTLNPWSPWFFFDDPHDVQIFYQSRMLCSPPISTPQIYKKCERRYCASSMGCIRNMKFEDRLRNTTRKSVNPAAFRLMVVGRTVDYQQWNIYQFSSNICSVFQRNQVRHKTVKINTKVNRIRTSGSVHVTKQRLSLHPGFAFDVLWSDYYNHSVVRLEFRITSPLSSSDTLVSLCVSGE